MRNSKPDSGSGCDPDLISRFYDGELGVEEQLKVSEHLKGCASCEKLLREFRSVSVHFRAEYTETPSHADFEEIGGKVLNRIKRKKAFQIPNLKESFFSKRIYIPLAAAATVVLVLFSVFNIMGPNPGPSAIVNSFTGQVSSVMILETPGTHHTIVWFSEELTTNGEADASPKT